MNESRVNRYGCTPTDRSEYMSALGKRGVVAKRRLKALRLQQLEEMRRQLVTTLTVLWSHPTDPTARPPRAHGRGNSRTRS